MSSSSSSLKILLAGAMMIPAAVYGNELSVEQRKYNILPSHGYNLSYSSTESIMKIYNQDVLEMAKIDLQKANLNIVAVENYVENDEELGSMKVVDIFVEKKQHSLKEIVALNMQIINKYSLFENKIVFMVYAV